MYLQQRLPPSRNLNDTNPTAKRCQLRHATHDRLLERCERFLRSAHTFFCVHRVFASTREMWQYVHVQVCIIHVCSSRVCSSPVYGQYVQGLVNYVSISRFWVKRLASMQPCRASTSYHDAETACIMLEVRLRDAMYSSRARLTTHPTTHWQEHARCVSRRPRVSNAPKLDVARRDSRRR